MSPSFAYLMLCLLLVNYFFFVSPKFMLLLGFLFLSEGQKCSCASCDLAINSSASKCPEISYL